MAPLVIADNLSFFQPAERIWLFRGLSFEVQCGSSLVITGRSGCGKSTLLRILAGLLLPTGGALHWNQAINGARNALMFQDARLLPWRRALDNVMLGCETHKVSSEIKRNRAIRALARVGLHDLAARYPKQLSGGQQQRVALARALCSEAPVLLLDEPFSALDPRTKDDMHAILRRIVSEDRSIVVVTHDPRDATALGADILDFEARALDEVA